MRVHHVAVLDDADVRRQHAAEGDRAVAVFRPFRHLDRGLGGVAGHGAAPERGPQHRRGAPPEEGGGGEAHLGYWQSLEYWLVLLS